MGCLSWVRRRKTTAIYRERTVLYSSLLHPQEHMSAGCSLPPGIGDTPRGTCHNIPFTYYEPPRCMPQAQHPSTKRKCSGSINTVPDPNSGELREYLCWIRKQSEWIINYAICEDWVLFHFIVIFIGWQTPQFVTDCVRYMNCERLDYHIVWIIFMYL